MNRINKLIFVAVFSMSLAAVPNSAMAGAGGTDLSKFPLTKAIPADVFVAVAAKANPERKFLNDHWATVTSAFWESGIVTDVWDMASDAMSDEHAEQVEAAHEQFSTLCHKVQWGSLFDQEMIHVGRMVMPQGPMSSLYEGAMLGRMDEKRAAENYHSLKAIFDEIAKFAEAKAGEPVLRVVETKLDDFTYSSLMPKDVPFHILCVGHFEDVIAVSFGGQKIMIDCVDLLQGKGEQKQLIKNERFTKAFSTLPAAEDELFFFDPPAMFGPVSKLLKMFSGQAEGKKKPAEKAEGEAKAEGEESEAAEEKSEEALIMGGIIKLLDDISIFDHIAGVEWTEGLSVHSQTMTVLTKDAKKSPFYGVIGNKCAGQNFDRFVPKEAKTFACGSGINMTKLYHYLRDFMGEVVPGGKDLLSEFDRIQKEDWNLNIEKDILSLIEGPTISIQMGTADSVVMFKVTDEAAAAAQLKKLFAKLNDLMGPEQALQLSSVEIAKGATFTQISHPMMMMMGVTSPPVIGCAEGHLMIGSSGNAVKRCLQTAAGKHANVLKNKRFMKEGLQPSKGEEIDSISFTDESATAQELQQFMGVMSMVMGFAGMGAADAPPQAQAILQGIPPILAKLGPVVGKMDFFQSSADVCTFDGQVYRTRAVQNYKEPRPEEEAVENGEDAESKNSNDDEAP